MSNTNFFWPLIQNIIDLPCFRQKKNFELKFVGFNLFCGPNIFGPNILWIQRFQYPKFFFVQNFLWLKFFSTKDFLESIFLEPHIFLSQNLFDRNNFLDQYFLDPDLFYSNCFGQKKMILFGKKFIDQNYFSTQNVFWPKIFCT